MGQFSPFSNFLQRHVVCGSPWYNMGTDQIILILVQTSERYPFKEELDIKRTANTKYIVLQYIGCCLTVSGQLRNKNMLHLYVILKKGLFTVHGEQ